MKRVHNRRRPPKHWDLLGRTARSVARRCTASIASSSVPTAGTAATAPTRRSGHERIAAPAGFLARPVLLLGRRGHVDREAVALGEHGDRAHIHLEPVLLPHSAYRLLVERALVGRREQRFYLREVALEARGGD